MGLGVFGWLCVVAYFQVLVHRMLYNATRSAPAISERAEMVPQETMQTRRITGPTQLELTEAPDYRVGGGRAR